MATRGTDSSGADAPKATKGPAVPAAARTMALFEIFAQGKRELTKSEVARLLDLPESSSSDLLNTLHQLGYISRTAGTRRFYPTNRLLATATEIAKNDTLVTFAAEAAALLAERTGETSFCARLIDAGQVEVLASVDGRHPLRWIANSGDKYYAHATAIGKALLSGLSDEEARHLLRERRLVGVTAQTKVEPQTIEQEIEQARDHGVFRSLGESVAGGVAFAMSGRIGDQLLGICIAGPSERMLGDEKSLVEALTDVARQVFDSK